MHLRFSDCPAKESHVKEFFPSIPTIKFEGADSLNPLAFKHYDPKAVVAGKPMAEWLRFSMAYWHTMCGDGSDPFGRGTMQRPWDTISDPMEKAKARMQALFELTAKLDIPFYCFHDRDIAPEGANLKESNANLDAIVKLAAQLQKDSKTKLLWGTANCFSHPRYMHGAATNPSVDVYAYAAAQVKKAMEVTKELGGENYVFWGGREGYETLLNTDMGQELDNLAAFFHMAVDYAKKIGFKGQFLIEPKPKEPTKHQYDFDSQSVFGFLKKYGLEKSFKLNIETNHATLAGHTVQHELAFARINGMLGSVDANQGDLLLGWDTDQFPTDLYVSTSIMYEILLNGGLGTGGLNFDSKPRRGSFLPEDIAIAHIAGMDSFARGLKAAAKLTGEGTLAANLKQRYKSWDSDLGKQIKAGKCDFATLEAHALKTEPMPESGRQEYLETVVNRAL
jgi:xylose isomerase